MQHLEETTLSSDLAQGYALKALTELLWLFVEHDRIKNFYKTKLVGFILNGYLSLRKLVVQRTKLIDETQERLLELLEELTTGRSCVFWGWGGKQVWVWGMGGAEDQASWRLTGEAAGIAGGTHHS